MDEFDQYRSEEEELLLLGEDVTSQLTQLKKPKPPPPLTESQLASSPCCSCASADADQPVEEGGEGGDAADVTAASQVISEQKNPPLNAPITVAHRRDLSSNLNTLSIVKSPLSDGFNWRKYGQKQVKTPQGSRSYYKCTHSDCSAKKIECSDLNGHLVETVNKGLHSHDPPFNNNYYSLRDNKAASSTTSAVYTEHPIKMLSNGEPDHVISLKESIKETSVVVVHERKRPNSASDDGNSEMQDKEKPISDSEPKKRMKKCNSENLTDLSKPEKKPKFVVHAAGDVGISGDGYRWRKYGQKMVKGNPHPRNYYRCTSAGCPVRKHIEADVDNTSAVIITYKGVHDHDMPVPKKRHGPTSAPLLTAAAPASKNNNGQQKKSDSNQNQKTQWSVVDKEAEITGESTTAVGGEKVVESARTLLSVGFEIKPC